ncbi:TonB-dependent receptor [Pseudomaricurvus alkylphenolicus]|uniref:TonB-dependent receptor n=1 Tax=Pseudomaricurvus alkylphenolicus TaxID=1306991 RepID=UPI00141EE658|nr:TonB-dependent receptor [Pseudomaricurvus alkylphenolicus]NIB38278.1 TonB-dependent receptor [Pseudomaricurvus alkylphenolicus]
MRTTLLRSTLAIAALSHGLTAQSDSARDTSESDSIEEMEVTGRQVNLIGASQSASQGLVGQEEIAIRPLLRTGEVLELVPGMVVTQHSGTGKANQYFLRGFNLDHGTDFATFIDGMPINMRSHGHGQGYTDLNFVIPETIETLAYKKGAYYADVGDFSGAGSAAMQTFTQRNQGQAEISLGEDSYGRLLLTDSMAAAGGHLLYAVEHNRYQGPWKDVDEDLDKTNVLLKHTRPWLNGELSLAFMGYDNRWNSADQIPHRAVRQHIIDELGSIDDSAGGESSRYSVNAQWKNQQWQWSAYAIRYDMNLWSNFTYHLDDSVNGDQFEQADKRWIYGGAIHYQFELQSLFGKPMRNRLGVELRYDDIDEVALYKTQGRQRLGTVRRDAINEFSIGAYWENQLQWSKDLKTIIGLRHDRFDFEVDNLAGNNTFGIDLNGNSGNEQDALTSLKASIVYTLNRNWETYASIGEGFHSNDARGTTITVDPANGAGVDAVDPLVGSLGYEVGFRGFITERLNTSLALWHLELDNELLFVGDAGNTETSRESERQGLEFTAYFRLNEHWNLDLEYAYTDAEFSDSSPDGNHIPGAVEHVWQAGINAQFHNGWFGSLRLRYFGERPLEESGDITSDSTTVANLRLGYKRGPLTLEADVLNLFDSNDHDIDYFYESRLSNEVNAVEDVHYHPLEPRTVRVSAKYRY